MVNVHGLYIAIEVTVVISVENGYSIVRYDIHTAWASALLILGRWAMREPCVRDER